MHGPNLTGVDIAEASPEATTDGVAKVEALDIMVDVKTRTSTIVRHLANAILGVLTHFTGRRSVRKKAT